MEEAQGTGRLPTLGLRPTERPSSSQAYIIKFKFQSILADDLLEFYLEYFPELKQRKVDAIPGERGLAHRQEGLSDHLAVLPAVWPEDAAAGHPAGGAGEQTRPQAPGSSLLLFLAHTLGWAWSPRGQEWPQPCPEQGRELPPCREGRPRAA